MSDVLSPKFVEYHSILIEGKQLQKEIEDFMAVLSARPNVQYKRCSDYNKRVIHLVFAVDDLNIEMLNQSNIEKIVNIVTRFRANRQKQFELEEFLGKEKVVARQNFVDSKALFL